MKCTEGEDCKGLRDQPVRGVQSKVKERGGIFNEHDTHPYYPNTLMKPSILSLYIQFLTNYPSPQRIYPSLSSYPFHPPFRHAI